jgi:acyl-CoA oxidase
MTDHLNGGKKQTAKRKFIMSAVMNKNTDNIADMEPDELLASQVENFIDVHLKWVKKGWKPDRDDIAYMAELTIHWGSISNHYMIFLPTITTNGTKEQIEYWYAKGLKFEIVGSYAQTELGHGSNVRGLSTTAVYDKNTQEFVVNTPSLRSIKWWPGALGKTATHATLYAQLIIDGKQYGV